MSERFSGSATSGSLRRRALGAICWRCGREITAGRVIEFGPVTMCSGCASVEQARAGSTPTYNFSPFRGLTFR